mmetsp:Transcript_117493/g.175471  ORF Transcript_117493/g.175471 Transcript_117493/m.175471 type:complete len:200 (+) Transcript_117493:55-654(+)
MTHGSTNNNVGTRTLQFIRFGSQRRFREKCSRCFKAHLKKWRTHLFHSVSIHSCVVSSVSHIIGNKRKMPRIYFDPINSEHAANLILDTLPRCFNSVSTSNSPNVVRHKSIMVDILQLPYLFKIDASSLQTSTSSLFIVQKSFVDILPRSYQSLNGRFFDQPHHQKRPCRRVDTERLQVNQVLFCVNFDARITQKRSRI